MDQVGVDSEEFNQAFERCAELTESTRYGGLAFFLVKLTILCAEEPAQIKTTKVATGDFSPYRYERRERAFALDPIIPSFILGYQGQNDFAVFSRTKVPSPGQ